MAFQVVDSLVKGAAGCLRRSLVAAQLLSCIAVVARSPFATRGMEDVAVLT